MAAGRADEALHGLRLATRADLAGVDTWLGVVVALCAAGAVAEASDAAEEAVEACRRALELAPSAPGPRRTAAILCALRGDRRGAQSMFEDAARRRPARRRGRPRARGRRVA